MLSVWGYILAIFFIVAPSVATGIFLNLQQLKYFWGWFMEWVKSAWVLCLYLLTGIRKRLAGWLLFLAFVCICFALWFFGSDVLKLYKILFEQIKDIDAKVPDQIKGVGKSVDKYFGIAIRYFGIIAAAGAIIGYIIAIARNLISDNQNKISERGQITESMVHAIAHIGTFNKNEPNIEVRLGGIYSLERIAQDSDRDHAKIMNILCAYVRATALKNKKPIRNIEDTREDTQAAIDVLGTKTKKTNFLEKQAKFRVNLENCDLSGYNFNNGNFNRYTKNGKNGAIFDDSLFKKALFQQADLSYVSFDGATLTGADFEDATLKGARFEGAKVHGADFSKAKYLTQDQLNEMIGDKKTKIPDRKTIKYPQHWLIPKSRKP